ncbi:hypothetical protein LPJ61_002266 [Coemansia biformis]|uniref:LigT-like protein n=1 Tax=Coemansia biformis TaxID=1286918 RepID=A0A9W7YF54_9FUNG|nr:hypothetical protein LPJ61_002266 [Coemansia biformis]
MAPKYTIWLCPPAASPAHSKLAAAINSLSATLGGPRFPPHATLFSRIPANSDSDAVEQVSRYAAELRRHLGSDLAGVPVEVDSLATSDNFYQCVVLKEVGSATLAAASAVAREHWAATDRPPFFPHVSLVYGDHPPAKMAALKEQVSRVLPADLASLSYVATEISIFTTSGPCEQWHEVGRVSIALEGKSG